MTPEQLRTLTPEAAAALDPAALAVADDLLRLEAELEWEISSRFAGPRLLLLALTFLAFLALQRLVLFLPWDRMGPLGIPVYLALLGAAVLGTRAAWRHAGRRVREAVRTALHFWPVVLYLLATFGTTAR